MLRKNWDISPWNSLRNRCAWNSVAGNEAWLELPRSKCLIGEVSTIYLNAYQPTTKLAFSCTWRRWKKRKVLDNDRIMLWFYWVQRLNEEFWIAASSEFVQIWQLFLLQWPLSWNSGWVSSRLVDWKSTAKHTALKSTIAIPTTHSLSP